MNGQNGQAMGQPTGPAPAADFNVEVMPDGQSVVLRLRTVVPGAMQLESVVVVHVSTAEKFAAAIGEALKRRPLVVVPG